MKLLKRNTIGLLAVIGMGILSGAGGFTFFYAKGTSYLMDDPRTCKNCHIMREQFDGWNRSSHHAVTTCNSCHTPKNMVGKYATKAINGWNHSFAFTTGHYEEILEIHDFNAGIAHDNCVRCHKDVISGMTANAYPEKVDCIHCHGNVGHNNKL